MVAKAVARSIFILASGAVSVSLLHFISGLLSDRIVRIIAESRAGWPTPPAAPPINALAQAAGAGGGGLNALAAAAGGANFEFVGIAAAIGGAVLAIQKASDEIFRAQKNFQAICRA